MIFKLLLSVFYFGLLSLEQDTISTCVPPTESDIQLYVIGGQFIRVIPHGLTFRVIEASGLTGRLKVYNDGTYDIGLLEQGIVRYNISRECQDINEEVFSDTLSFTYSELLQRTISLDSTDTDSITYLSQVISTQQSVNEDLGLNFIDSVVFKTGFEVREGGGLQVQQIQK